MHSTTRATAAGWLLAAATATTAQADTRTGVDWVDWIDAGSSGVVGQLALGDGSRTTATFTGAYQQVFTGPFPEPYWGPDFTYRGSVLDNGPPSSDGITIAGGPGRLVITFAQAVTDPVIAIASLGLTNADRSINLQAAMFFEQPFEVLSNGPNFYAEGEFTPFVVSGNGLYGTESSGTIRFKGSFTQLAWTSPTQELNDDGDIVGTYLFTVGTAGCRNYELPAGADLVRAGCSAYSQGSFAQGAALEVNGIYRALGGHEAQAALRIGAGALVEHADTLRVTEAGAVQVDGRLDGGAVEVASGGRLSVTSGGRWQAAGLALQDGGHSRVDGQATLDGAIDIAGVLEVGAGGTLTTGAPVRVGGGSSLVAVEAGAAWEARAGFDALEGATVEVAGTLAAAGALAMDRAALRVAPGGLLELRGGGAMAASQLDNRGRVLQTQGTFVVDAGSTLDNAGHWQVDRFARLEGKAFSVLRNGGTMQIDGLLNIDGGTLENHGRIHVGSLGALEIVTSRWLGTGRVDVGNLGTLLVDADVQLPGGARVVIGDGGRFDLRPDARFDVAAGARLEVATAGAVNGGSGVVFSLSDAGQVTNDGRIDLPGGLISSRGLFHNRGASRVVADLVQVDGGVFDIATASFVQAGAFVQNGGTVTVNGVLATGGASFLGGVLQGSGVIQGPAFIGNLSAGNTIRVSPGNSPGTLTFDGDVEMTNAELVIELGDWSRQDRIVVTGQLRAENVAVQLQAPTAYSPDLNDRFDWLVVGGGVEGDLGDVALPALADGWRFERQDEAGGALVVWNDAAQALATREVGAGEEAALAAGSLNHLDGELRVRDQGRVVVGGALAVRSGAQVVLDTGSVLVIEPGGRVSNRGQLDLDGFVANQGLLRNYGDGTMRVATAGLINVGRFETAGTVLNELAIVNAAGGEFVVTETGALRAGAGDVRFRDDGGQLRVDGLLEAPWIQLQGTRLAGGGRLVGLVEGTATFELAASERMTIEGELRGTFGFELAALDELSFGRLQIDGSALLQGGQVTLVLADGGWTPQAGLTLVWLDVDNGVAQGLESLDWRIVSRGAHGDSDWRLPAGLGVEFTGDRFESVAVPVPEPGGLALMLAGLLAIVALKGRRLRAA